MGSAAKWPIQSLSNGWLLGAIMPCVVWYNAGALTAFVWFFNVPSSDAHKILYYIHFLDRFQRRFLTKLIPDPESLFSDLSRPFISALTPSPKSNPQTGSFPLSLRNPFLISTPDFSFYFIALSFRSI